METLQFFVIQSFFWVSGAVFAYPLIRRDRFAIKSGFCLAGSIVCMVIFWLLQIPENMGLQIAAYAIGSVLLVAFIYICWRCSLSVAIYNAIWGITIWQLLVEAWAVVKLWGVSFFAEKYLVETILLILLFGIGYGICAGTIARWMARESKKSIGPRQLTSALLIFGVIETLAFSEEFHQITASTSEWKFLFVCQLLGVIVLYLQNEIFKKVAMRQELALMNLLWKKEQEHYELTKENINLINQKCHDLKHQIRALRKVSKEEFDKYLDSVEDEVRIYESIVKTGNDVFDTILTEKSLYCKDREIQVSCVADGSQMDFIETIDLYAILGNAMDNAIEAVEKFKDPQMRQIDVIICRQKNFLVMNFINPVSEILVYEDELPVSTKGDSKFHGFGLRSIRHFVKKYNGFLNINEEDGCFSLKIMIPIPNKEN